ncbi:hypothetical protein [Pseudarthrobacter sp. PS3-L1]|uniref:hypothetical protein n=1 Tax=Pseudarthrobacter sp. PS3-L1 TaxID=3046207 RepID=UPI0024BB6C0A|nr:hypothetical protein [Pseudarthrobacter sp. PS3-L1]MDJ0319970.1 hypothetical protein [Pseudarthrobacter sp. PS3-L1]
MRLRCLEEDSALEDHTGALPRGDFCRCGKAVVCCVDDGLNVERRSSYGKPAYENPYEPTQ